MIRFKDWLKSWTRDNIIQLLTLITVSSGFLFGYLQLSTMKQSIYCSSLLTYQENWIGERLENARAKVRELDKVRCEHFLPEGNKRTEECIAVRRISAFFELMGWAVSNGYIQFDDVKPLYGSSLLHYWNKFKGAIEAFRKKVKDEAIYEHFESFAERYQKAIESNKIK